VRTGLWLAAAAFAVGCATEEDLFDPFPVPVDLTSGPVLVAASTDDGATKFIASVDTLTPVTIVDNFVAGEETAPRRRQVDLLICDQGETPVARWLFPEVSTLDVHPCGDPDGLCEIGLGDTTTAVRAIIGADTLARGAVSFEFPSSQMRFFPDVAGDNGDRGRACEAVFVSPFAGGGTLVIEDAEITYQARRIALGACLHYDALNPEQQQRGAAALMLISTGLGTTLLSHSAYDRYAAVVDDPAIAPPRSSLPITDLYLPSGRTDARLGSITRIALLGEGSDQRGPCKELYANHLMSASTAGCGEDGAAVGDDGCPCTENRSFCSTAAAVEIDSVIAVAIVPDTIKLLQALRTAMRPKLPEVDGILGVNALAKLRLDVDYPNERALASCQDPTGCTVRPAVRNRDAVEQIAHCPGVR